MCRESVLCAGAQVPLAQQSNTDERAHVAFLKYRNLCYGPAAEAAAAVADPQRVANIQTHTTQ